MIIKKVVDKRKYNTYNIIVPRDLEQKEKKTL